MLLWFAAVSVLIVVVVFDSAAVDHRFVVVGAVAPVAEGLVGGPWLLHTLVGSVGLLVVVVLATRGRRVAARRLVGLPIGTFLHLVLDGTWTRSDLFWWPFLGTDALGVGQLPEIENLGRSLVLEVVGVGVTVWLVRRFGLHDADRREQFRRTGRLQRA